MGRPESSDTQIRLALCLSGGGFRASLFHLGVLRRLWETGVLAKVTTVSSVSGGSILSGHLAQVMVRFGWDSLAKVGDFESQIAVPFREFTARDFRTLPVLCTAPVNWLFPRPRAQWVSKRYRKRLIEMLLKDLPEKPRFVFCAADLAFGVNWEFTKTRLGDYRAGYARTPDSLPLAFAVAASASFPPIFGPMRVPVPIHEYQHRGYLGDDYPTIMKGLRLTDGGVYDNLGLEPALKRHDGVLVSDCGAPFAFKASRVPILRHGRYLSTIMNQVSALRKRMLFDLIDPKRRVWKKCVPGRSDNGEQPTEQSSEIRTEVSWKRKADLSFGTYVGLASDVKGYGCALEGLWQGYPKDIVKTRVAAIRTDLDAFTQAEQAVLENHGYSLAEAALTRHLPWLKNEKRGNFKPPHPKWLEPEKVIRALKFSGNRLLHPRWFSVFGNRS